MPTIPVYLPTAVYLKLIEVAKANRLTPGKAASYMIRNYITLLEKTEIAIEDAEVLA